MMGNRGELKQEYRYSLRSQQVLGLIFICCVTIFILMSVCLMSSYWITSDGFRQGLLYLCIEEPSQNDRNRYEPLPFDLNKEELEPGCYPNRDKGNVLCCPQQPDNSSICTTNTNLISWFFATYRIPKGVHFLLPHYPAVCNGKCMSDRNECSTQRHEEGELRQICNMHHSSRSTMWYGATGDLPDAVRQGIR